MKSEAQCSTKRVFKLGLLSIALLFMANADALLLGDIQVNSALGQPLKARIAIVDLSGVDVQQLKMRLASVEVYQNLGLQYPDPHKFNFLLVNEQGALLPVIRVTTPYPVVDPFINLLVEVSSPAGRLIKAYTFLLDPSADSPVGAIVSQPLLPATKIASGVASPVNVRHHKHGKHQPARLKVAQIEHGLPHSSSQMRLALSLSISSYDPSSQVSTSRDALQEELIAKEKSLEDLKLQIGEMQMVIKSLEEKRGADAGSSVAAVASVSSVPAGSSVQPVREKPAVVQVEPRWTINWLYVDLALGVALLSGAVALYRKHKQSQAWQQGPFDDLYEAELMKAEIKEPLSIKEPVFIKEELMPEAVLESATPVSLTEVMPQTEAPQQAEVSHEPMAFESVSFGEPVTSGRSEQEPIVPLEYAILMEAKRHLRAGNDELAEEALIRAIAVNPRNLYGYQALLDIYEARKDTGQFERIARQLKENGDVTGFEEVAERGRILDPENPLYL